MAAGDNIAITNNKVAALNAFQTVTIMAADADTANLAQKFIYTPTGKDNKVAIFVSVADTHGAVATSIKAGAGVFGIAAKTDSVAQATTEFVQIETGRFMQADGTIEITLTPASGKTLASEHAAKLYVVELQ
jgi:hypothetical protein